MTSLLKQFLVLATLAGSLALGSERVTLDSMLVDAQGSSSSLFVNHSQVPRGGVTLPPHEGNSVTFYVEVGELSGARKMKSGKTYRLDSFSWIGHPAGWWTGRGREVVIANGNREVAGDIEDCKDELIKVDFRGDRNPLTFKKNDVLEVTIISPSDVDTHVEYFDAPPAPARLKGSAMNMLPDGSLAGGNAADNKYNKNWRYTCPAVRIRATQVDEMDWKRLALYAGGALVAFFLLKPLFGGGKKK